MLSVLKASEAFLRPFNSSDTFTHQTLSKQPQTTAELARANFFRNSFLN